MKKVDFTNIALQDFCAHRGLKSFDLGHRTFIKGANETGKSTLKKAIQYALNICAENGKEIAGIRPHDENGVDIDGLTTMSQLTVSVDGVENTVKKTFFQKKNRQNEYTGENDTQYFVDDVKKPTKKGYDEFISAIIPHPVCINAQTLLKEDTAGRKRLLEPFIRHTDDDIIAENPEFEELRGKLKANTVSDLKKTCRTKIDGTKAENYQDGLNGQLAKVNYQIEFEQSKKKSIDLAELELQRNALKEQIADIEVKEAEVSKQYEEYDKQSKDILDLQFALSDLERKANEELRKKRIDIDSEQVDCQKELGFTEQRIKRNKQNIEILKDTIKKNSNLINICREDWKQANERVFDENSLICSYCGQEYPEDKKEQLRAEFESHKAEELETVTKRGNELKVLIDKVKEDIEKLKSDVEKDEKLKTELETRISELETQYNALPQSIDISDREDVKQIKQQIADKESAMQNCNSADEIRQELLDKKSELQSQLIEVEAQFKVAEEYEKNNEKADMEIEKLKKQRMEIVQQTADIQRELDLLKQFERKKAEILEADVNSVFEFAKVKMFEPQVNGELKDICTFTYKGESYDRNLNHGARILIEIDICRAFQKIYDVCLPVILDDTESINSFNLPNIENQLILLRCTDDKELIIETRE